ncbi:MAG TPA: EamA family transporter [Candidatus Kryptonia bacterium]|nr:EamA family transporter [Candidatus Kryptonia bacterium]
MSTRASPKIGQSLVTNTSHRAGAAGAWWIVAAAVLWSTGGAGIKFAPMPAMTVVCGRALFVLAFYLSVFRPRLRKASPAIACAYAGSVICFVSATKLTTAANAIFLQFTAPVYVLVCAPLFLNEPFRRIDALTVAIALIGMALFFIDRFAPGSLSGNLLGLLAGVFVAVDGILLRRESARGAESRALPSVTAGNMLAAGVAFPFAWHDPGAALTLPGALVLGYLGIVQIGVALLCYLRGLRTVGAIDASIIGMLEAALNPVWALIITGERPGGWALLGGVLILASTAVRTLVLQAKTRYATAT